MSSRRGPRRPIMRSYAQCSPLRAQKTCSAATPHPWCNRSEDGLQLIATDGSWPEHGEAASEFIAGQIDDRGGRAGQLAAVERQVHLRTDARVHVLESASVGLAGRVRARLEHRPAHGAQRLERTVERGHAEAD